MMNTALMDNERVRRTSAGNLLDDPEAAATGQPTVRKASLPGLGLSALAAGVDTCGCSRPLLTGELHLCPSSLSRTLNLTLSFSPLSSYPVVSSVHHCFRHS